MTTKSEPSLTMNSDLDQAFSLVQGMFNADEAREILMALIESKMTFHSLKNLRSFEQSGEADPQSENRIEELEKMRNEMLELVKKAKKTNRQLDIDSKICISFAEDSPER